MSVKDFIKKSVLEGFSPYNVPQMAGALLGALAMGVLIYWVYQRFYAGVIFSRSFAMTLVGMSVLTCMVTLAISSNVVISLGMVGALSIVRFRTAIKDPIDLMFLFWSISVGIICGAGLAQVAIILSVILTLGILILDRLPVAKAPMILVVNATDLDAEQNVSRVVGKYAHFFSVKSRNMTADTLDLVLELRTEQGSTLVRDIMALEGITSASLLAHDGEVTF